MDFEKLPCELGRIRCLGKGICRVVAAVPPVLLQTLKEQGLDNRVAVRTSSVFRVCPGCAFGLTGLGRNNGVLRIDPERLSPGVAHVFGVLKLHFLISLRMDDENRHWPECH